jgi:hypothetical protein
VTFQDQDMSGTLTIPAGANSASINYNSVYNTTPVVTLTGVGHGSLGYIIESTSSGFKVKVDQTPTQDIKFNWIAINNGQDNSLTSPISSASSSQTILSSSVSSSSISSPVITVIESL